MKIRHIYKVFFSPTGTTKQVVSAIADVMAQNLSAPTFTFDFTLPQARTAAQNGSPAAGWPAAGAEDLPAVSAGDLVVFGCPTYAGRLPNLLLKYLHTITGSGALALPVVTFGNRNFDNSLIELRDLLEDHGFHTIAAAACSCEHSFSYVLGGGRPDKEDLKEICDFALRAAEKIEGIQTLSSATTSASPADSATSAVSSTPASSAATAPTAVSATSAASVSPVYPAPVQVPGIPAEEGHGGYYQPRDRHGVFIDIRKVKPLTDRSLCLRFTAPAGNCTANAALAADSGGAAMTAGSGDSASGSAGFDPD